MNKRFKFTLSALRALPVNPSDSSSTELEFSDTEVVGLKCSSGKTDSKRFLLRYKIKGRKFSISIGQFSDVYLTSARQVARKYKTMIANDINPKTEREIPNICTFYW
jgi:hypothetical protein